MSRFLIMCICSWVLCNGWITISLNHNCMQLFSSQALTQTLNYILVYQIKQYCTATVTSKAITTSTVHSPGRVQPSPRAQPPAPVQPQPQEHTTVLRIRPVTRILYSHHHEYTSSASTPSSLHLPLTDILTRTHVA